jgi:hypothetical protein
MWMNRAWMNATTTAMAGVSGANGLRHSKLDALIGRINMIAAYCQQELMAPFTVEGTCNRVVFETWLETCLVPNLKPGQVLILDNATFHHGGRIQELLEAAGCRLLYLPPYSPDYNRIEKCWAWLKSRIRQHLSDGCSLRAAMELVLKDAAS